MSTILCFLAWKKHNGLGNLRKEETHKNIELCYSLSFI